MEVKQKDKKHSYSASHDFRMFETCCNLLMNNEGKATSKKMLNSLRLLVGVGVGGRSELLSNEWWVLGGICLHGLRRYLQHLGINTCTKVM